MPLRDPRLLSLLRQQKTSDAQKRHAERVSDAHRRTAGNLNGAAYPAALTEAHEASMRDFGSTLLAAYKEAFEGEHEAPTEDDQTEIVEEIVAALQGRYAVAVDELERMARRTGRALPHVLPGLARARDRLITDLQRDAEVWRRKRCLEGERDGGPVAQQMVVNVSVSGSHNQVAVAGRDQHAVTQAARTEPLTAEAADLLRAATKTGELLVMEADQLGRWVRVESRDFVDAADPALAARYLDALDLLCRRDLARHSSQGLFTLTGAGMTEGRAL